MVCSPAGIDGEKITLTARLITLAQGAMMEARAGIEPA